MMENTREDELEIDLKQIFYVLKEKILVILAVGLLFGCIACVATKFFMTPTYTSTSSMLLLINDKGFESTADLQMGSQLTKDYSVLITSRPVLEKTIENLKLDMSYEQLKESIAVDNPEDTRILNITVTDTDPKRTQKIVNEVVANASAFIGDKMEVTAPKIIDEGQFPTHKAGPNMKKNALLGLLLGLILSAGIFVVIAIMDDTIKTEADIEKHLGLSTLTSVPDRKDYINSKHHGKKKKNKKGRR